MQLRKDFVKYWRSLSTGNRRNTHQATQFVLFLFVSASAVSSHTGRWWTCGNCGIYISNPCQYRTEGSIKTWCWQVLKAGKQRGDEKMREGILEYFKFLLYCSSGDLFVVKVSGQSLNTAWVVLLSTYTLTHSTHTLDNTPPTHLPTRHLARKRATTGQKSSEALSFSHFPLCQPREGFVPETLKLELCNHSKSTRKNVACNV